MEEYGISLSFNPFIPTACLTNLIMKDIFDVQKTLYKVKKQFFFKHAFDYLFILGLCPADCVL